MAVKELRTFECGCCLGTYTGRHQELNKLGWVRKALPKGGGFLLCGECVERFLPAWTKLEEAA